MVFNITGSNNTIIIVTQTNISLGGSGSQSNVFMFGGFPRFDTIGAAAPAAGGAGAAAPASGPAVGYGWR